MKVLVILFLYKLYYFYKLFIFLNNHFTINFEMIQTLPFSNQGWTYLLEVLP